MAADENYKGLFFFRTAEMLRVVRQFWEGGRKREEREGVVCGCVEAK